MLLHTLADEMTYYAIIFGSIFYLDSFQNTATSFLVL